MFKKQSLFSVIAFVAASLFACCTVNASTSGSGLTPDQIIERAYNSCVAAHGLELCNDIVAAVKMACVDDQECAIKLIMEAKKYYKINFKNGLEYIYDICVKRHGKEICDKVYKGLYSLCNDNQECVYKAFVIAKPYYEKKKDEPTTTTTTTTTQLP